MSERRGHVPGDVGRVEIGLECAVDQVAETLAGLAHDRRSDHHAQGVEGDRGTVAVGIGHQGRLQHAVVEARRGSWPGPRSPAVTWFPSASSEPSSRSSCPS